MSTSAEPLRKDRSFKMSPEAQETTTSISTKQMRDAIQRSGYLLEQRVEPILVEEGFFYVQTNPVFPDPDTGKSREIDISALSATRIYKKGYNFIFPMMLCECENNSQPIVFFTKESVISSLFHMEVKVSGIPVKFWQDDGYVSLSEFTGMGKFHHYCKGAVATQYCTFQLKKDKSSWAALHNEEQHDTFNSLLKALDYEIAEHFDGWSLPDKVDDEDVNIQIYYPLVIFQGSLYSATLKNNQNKQVSASDSGTAKETAGVVRYIGARKIGEMIEETIENKQYIEAFVHTQLGIEKILWDRVVEIFEGKKVSRVRQIIEDSREGKDKSRTSTFELIKWAHFLGAITEDEFSELIDFNNERNRIIHGHGQWWDAEEYKEALKKGIRFLRENGLE